jgi:hypothetical protein
LMMCCCLLLWLQLWCHLWLLTKNDCKIIWTWRKEDHFVCSTPIPNMVHMYVNSTCGPPLFDPWSTYVPSTSFF